MDTFENASPPQEQPEMVLAGCWECGRTKMCHEQIVCCTGTHIHTCPDCRAIICRAASDEDSTALGNRVRLPGRSGQAGKADCHTDERGRE